MMAFAAMLLAGTAAQASNDKPVTVKQLPAKARTTLANYFTANKIALSKMEKGLFDKSYDVIFTNGDKVEFDSNGIWTKISCKQGSVPARLVPPGIMGSIKAQYPGVLVKEIEKDGSRYEVKLANDIELTYNRKMQLVDIDR